MADSKDEKQAVLAVIAENEQKITTLHNEIDGLRGKLLAYINTLKAKAAVSDDLLAACKAMIIQYEEKITVFRKLLDKDHPLIKAEQAITKAEGKG